MPAARITQVRNAPLAAQLRLRFAKYLDGTLATVPATLRVQTPAGIWKRSIMIPAGPDQREFAIEVPAGSFSVHITSPAGAIITEDGEVTDGEDKAVTIQGPHSQHEWLSWSSFALDSEFVHPAACTLTRRSRGATRGMESAVQSRPTLRDAMGAKGHIRFWHRAPNLTWQSTEVDVVPPMMSDNKNIVVLHLPQRAHTPGAHLLAEVAGDATARSEFCIVPWGWSTAQHGTDGVDIVVDLHSLPQGADAPPRLRVRTSVKDSDFALLSGFLRQGDITTLASVNEQVAPRAEELVMGKLKQPLLATAAALALLKTRQLHLLHDWTRNLAEIFPDIPDGRIIRAWHLLYGHKSAAESPQQLLLAAMQRGIPVFAESLRLLLNGLRLFHSKGCPQVQAAIAALEPYVWASDPDEEFTSYRGLTPSAPDAATTPDLVPGGAWSLTWQNPMAS